MAKKFAITFGWIFVILGVLGFISNPLIGSSPTALFAADAGRNIVDLITGIVLLWIAYGSPMKSGTTLKVIGIIYLIVAIVGFFSSSGSIIGLMSSNTAENWLDLIIALLFLWAGMSGKPVSVSQTM